MANMNEDKDGNDRKRVGSVKVSQSPEQGGVVARLSQCGLQVMPSAFERRSRFQRQTPITEHHVPERTSITTAMRKKHLKELTKPESGFSSVLSIPKESSQDESWALYQMEHAWMLSAVQGNYDTLLGFVSEDPYLLTRKDFISGYTVLHWLSKNGRDETLLKLLSYAQTSDLNVNVNVRGSGGLTPLHVACMHGHYMVIKLLVGAFGANVYAMDYNGKRAWQYLKANAPLEMKELLGTWDEDHNSNCNNNCVEICEPIIWDQVDCDVQESHFERTQTRKSWRFGSFRKLLQSFTLLGRNVEH